MANLDWHLISVRDGAPLWVLATKEEIEAHRKASPNNCDHPKPELRDYPTSNGGWQRKEQCVVCGLPVGSPQKREKSVDVPLWDMQLRSRWEAECQAQQEELEAALIERTANLESGGYAHYEDYLQSDDWKAKRALVLKRDANICQACLSEAATEVHHLTYDQIFDEYLFDLISVCRKCHSRLHKKKLAAKEAARAKGLL